MTTHTSNTPQVAHSVRAFDFTKPFRGMTPILPTPVDARGAIDEVSQRRLVRYCLDAGAVAIGHLAYASEFFKLSPDDRRQIIETVVDEVAGRVPVFIGVTAPSNRIAVMYAQEAVALGADMVMAALPFVTVPDADGARLYFREVCDAVSVPVILQDTPHSTAILTAELMIELFRKHENLRHVKPEGLDFLDKTEKLIRMSGGAFEVMGGFGGKHMLHMLRMGVTSFMTGTEALELHAAVVRTYLAGDEEEAAAIYYQKILPYFMFYNDYPEELLKRILHLRKVIDCPDALTPRVPGRMKESEWNEFYWVLERVGLAAPWRPSRDLAVA